MCMKLLHSTEEHFILAEVSLNICSALKARYLLRSSDLRLLGGRPVAHLCSGWKSAGKLQQEGFGPLNIRWLLEHLAAEAGKTAAYFLP